MIITFTFFPSLVFISAVNKFYAFFSLAEIWLSLIFFSEHVNKSRGL